MYRAALRLYLLLAIIMIARPVFAQSASPSDQYQDASGKLHTWTINTSHTLVWDGQPYIPVGGVFCPLCLSDGMTPANIAQDNAALDKLKAAGFSDILINPAKSPGTISPQAWQTIIDSLEARGFRYGISFGQGITTPLEGRLVKPSAFRVNTVKDDGETTWKVSYADAAHYFITDSHDGSQIFREGDIPVKNGVAIAPAGNSVGSNVVGLLYPHITLHCQPDCVLPDIWSGFDAYRDNLLTVFSKVKFGPGLRFFLDPLCSHIGIPSESDYLVPDSLAWKLEWEAFLNRRYPSVDGLMNSWGIQDRDVLSIHDASRLIPLWANNRGIPDFIDFATGKKLAVKTDASRFWQDIHDCRNESLVYFINAMADLLKQQIANVPVIYTRSSLSPIFAGTNKIGGMDGYGIAVQASGPSIITGGVDSTVVQCEQAKKNMWLAATEVCGGETGSPDFPSRDSLFRDMDMLSDIGVKGFFVNGFQTVPGDHSGVSILSSSDKLDWLNAYAHHIATNGKLAEYKPDLLLYPIAASGVVHPGLVPNTDVWWCPTLDAGAPLVYGYSYAGYTLKQNGNQQTVLWSLSGVRQARLLMDNPLSVIVNDVNGLTLKGKIDKKKNIMALDISSSPVIFHTNGQDVFPLDAAEDAVLQLHGLIALGASLKLPTDQFNYYLERAESNYRVGNQRTSFMMAADAINGIMGIVQTYIWREAETADYQTFSDVAPLEAASNQKVLSLNTESAPGSNGYMAQYKIDVMRDGVYHLWVSGSPPGPTASPFVWAMDTDPPHSSSDAKVVGLPWMINQLVWMNLGDVVLKHGQHTLTLRVTEQAQALNRYRLILDSLLLTPDPFTPCGIIKPPLGLSLEMTKKSFKSKKSR
jgi:hypothetical protein